MTMSLSIISFFLWNYNCSRFSICMYTS